jgi:hypothetical protein
MIINKEYENKLYSVIRNTPDEYKETGQISGSKVAQPTLTAVLTMLGVEKPFDDYTLAKFMRGHDVEEKFIDRVFHKPVDVCETGHWDYEGSDFTWQYEMTGGYRGCTCSVDVLELPEKGSPIIHEIKSVSKMKYDRVCGTGFQKNKVSNPEPDHTHCLQVALYAMSYDKETGIIPRCIIHYVNADDYRVTSFEIEPEDYLDELNERIDAIYLAFKLHELPEYKPYESWQVGKYNSFSELEKLSKEQVNAYIKTSQPEVYEKFMKAELQYDSDEDNEEGIKYED